MQRIKIAIIQAMICIDNIILEIIINANGYFYSSFSLLALFTAIGSAWKQGLFPGGTAN